MLPGPRRTRRTTCKMAKSGKTKQTKGVDIVIILLVTVLPVFRRVLNEGNEDGVFDVMNVKLTAEIMHYCLKGCEVPYIFGRYTARGPEELYLYVRTLVTRQLQNKHTSLTINDN